MRAKPVILVPGEGYREVPAAEATHVTLNFPGPAGQITLPVIQRGTRAGTGCWTWNGDTEKPTLRPSFGTDGTYELTEAEYDAIRAGKTIEPRAYRCHTWVTDGRAQFLEDTTHELRGRTVDMLEVG